MVKWSALKLLLTKRSPWIGGGNNLNGNKEYIEIKPLSKKGKTDKKHINNYTYKKKN